MTITGEDREGDRPGPDEPAPAGAEGEEATAAEEGADAEAEDDESEESTWQETRLGRFAVLTYVVGTLVGVLVAVYDVGDLPLVSDGGGVYPVRGYVFLYAFMGASAYAVTSLVSDEKTTDDVIKLGLRVVGALPLAVGVWALAPAVGAGGNERVIAGLAFLAGLYVNLTLKTFGGVAERLMSPPGQ